MNRKNAKKLSYRIYDSVRYLRNFTQKFRNRAFSFFQKFLIFLLGSITLSACTVEVDVQRVGRGLSELLQIKVSNIDLVTTSQQGVLTAGGYSVQSSVDFHAGALEVTTASGYKVNTNVQSILFKE